MDPIKINSNVPGSSAANDPALAALNLIMCTLVPPRLYLSMPCFLMFDGSIGIDSDFEDSAHLTSAMGRSQMMAAARYMSCPGVAPLRRPCTAKTPPSVKASIAKRSRSSYRGRASQKGGSAYILGDVVQINRCDTLSL